MKSTLTGFALLLAAAMTVSVGCTPRATSITDKSFLKAVGKNLCNDHGKGKAVMLHGTNAGGYLLQELWMTPTQRTAHVKDELSIQSHLESRFGKGKARELETAYRDSFWTETDFDNVRALGANCIRLPFWYRTLTEENGELRADAFARIDWFVSEAGKRGLYVILDMHGAQDKQIDNMGKKIGLIARADYPAPSLMGEFNYFRNYDAWDKGLALLNKAGIHWTTWTYKTIAACGNWGIYHHAIKTGKINLEQALFESIKEFWGAMDDVNPNAELIRVLKKHM